MLSASTTFTRDYLGVGCGWIGGGLHQLRVHVSIWVVSVRYSMWSETVCGLYQLRIHVSI